MTKSDDPSITIPFCKENTMMKQKAVFKEKFFKRNMTGFTALVLLCAVLTGCGDTSDTYKESDDSQALTSEQGATDTVFEDTDAEIIAVDLCNKSVMITADEFKGKFNSVEVKNGGLTLKDGAKRGTFTSDEIDLGGSFDEMLASWNSSSKGGTVEVSVSVKLDNGRYTGWYSWGVWSAIQGVSGSASTSDSYGKVGIDILTLNEKCPGIVKFKVDIKQTKDTAPIVYNVTLACNKEESSLKAPDDTSKKLNVPYRRQGDVPEIGGSICSATSLSMLMLYHGADIEVEDVAWGVRDYGIGRFGNWAFNVAYAGELGYNAFIDYYDIDAIKQAIYTGHPVACSIRVDQGQLTQSGYPNYQTNGHLLCVVGYEERRGEKWLLINDPARPEVKAFLESEFETIYRGVSYIVQKRPTVATEK